MEKEPFPGLDFQQYQKMQRIFVNILETGFPSLIRQGMMSVSTMVLNYMSMPYGDAAIAAMSIVGRVCNFIFAVALGISQGFQPVSAFNYGAKKFKRVKEGFCILLWTQYDIIGIFKCCLTYIFRTYNRFIQR